MQSLVRRAEDAEARSARLKEAHAREKNQLAQKLLRLENDVRVLRASESDYRAAATKWASALERARGEAELQRQEHAEATRELRSVVLEREALRREKAAAEEGLRRAEECLLQAEEGLRRAVAEADTLRRQNEFLAAESVRGREQCAALREELATAGAHAVGPLRPCRSVGAQTEALVGPAARGAGYWESGGGLLGGISAVEGCPGDASGTGLAGLLDPWLAPSAGGS